MRLHNKLRPQRNMRTHISDFCARLPPTSTLLAQRPEGEVFNKALLMLFMTSFVFSTYSHCGHWDDVGTKVCCISWCARLRDPKFVTCAQDLGTQLYNMESIIYRFITITLHSTLPSPASSVRGYLIIYKCFLFVINTNTTNVPM